jgi:hypothetical protein
LIKSSITTPTTRLDSDNNNHGQHDQQRSSDSMLVENENQVSRGAQPFRGKQVFHTDSAGDVEPKE